MLKNISALGLGFLILAGCSQSDEGKEIPDKLEIPEQLDQIALKPQTDRAQQSLSRPE